MAEVTVRWYRAKISVTITSLSAQAAAKGADTLQARARRLAPTRTGALRASILTHPSRIGERSAYRVTAHAPYAGYQEHGTGPIYPRRPGGVLVFVPKGSSTVVFARRTSGVPAVHYMARARATLRPSDFA